MIEHGTVCPLCDETLHEGERCDDTKCPLGGSVSVAPKCHCAEPHYLPVWHCPVHGDVSVDAG